MAIFSNLSDKLSNAFNNMKRKGALTEEDVNAALKEIQIALLEADVNFRVVKDFIKTVKEKAIGENILKSLSPTQQVIDIVNKELIAILGGEDSSLNFNSNTTPIFLLCGLQGSGKTTTAGKLAYREKSKGKVVLMIAGDIYRPGAIDQLIQLGKKANVQVYFDKDELNVKKIVKDGIKKAKDIYADLIIIDTAGRQNIDDELMAELKGVKDLTNPTEVLLVVDSLMGQEAVSLAKDFNEKIGITGLCLTKVDSDSRGGAALSVKSVTGKPIKLMGTGEKIGDIQDFHPERIASRMLDMGDVLTLIEEVQGKFDEDEAASLSEKMLSNKFTLEDFLGQMNQIKKLGSLEKIIGMLPGANKLKDINIDDSLMVRVEAIVLSMTIKERRNPNILNASRKKRIALGSGTQVQDVNKVLKQFETTKKMMKQMNGTNGKKKMNMSNLSNFF